MISGVWQYAKNFRHATLAVQYVKKKLPKGANNRGLPLAFERIGGQSFYQMFTGEYYWFEVDKCVDPMKTSFEQKEKNLDRGSSGWVKALSKHAIKAGCGNCGEQSAVAFQYLSQNGVHPLDYMSLTDGDHAFVLIGRDKNKSPAAIGDWGPSAIVCDPWAGLVYRGDEALQKLKEGPMADAGRVRPVAYGGMTAVSEFRLD